MAISKTDAVAVTTEIMEAVNAILAKHGLDTPTVRTTYGDTYKIAITSAAVELNEAGINLASAEAIAYDRYHNAYGLNPGLLGTKAIIRGEEYTLLGLALKRSKYPIVTRNAAGKTLLWGSEIATKFNEAAAKAGAQ